MSIGRIFRSLLFLELFVLLLPVLAKAQPYSVYSVLTSGIAAQTVPSGVKSVLADGYYAVGDMPAVVYNLSTSACTAPDGGSQISSTAYPGDCWILAPQTIYDVRTWGAVSGGTDPNSNNATLINAAIAYINTLAPANPNVAMTPLTGGGLLYAINEPIVIGAKFIHFFGISLLAETETYWASQCSANGGLLELTTNTTMAIDHVQIDAGNQPINGLVGEANGNIHLDNVTVTDWSGSCSQQTVTGVPQIAGNGDAEIMVTSGGVGSLATGWVSRGNASAGLPDRSVIVDLYSGTNPYLILSKPLQTPSTSIATFTGSTTFNSTTKLNTLTVSSVTGTIVVGDYIQGAGVPALTVITSGSGSTYTVSGTTNLGLTSVPMTAYYYPYAAFTGTISGTSLAVTAPAPNSVFTPGQYVQGANVAPSTVITGGTGPYTVSVSQTISTPESMTASVYPIATFSGSISGNILTVGSLTGTIVIGQYVQGQNVAPSTVITATTPNITVSPSQTISVAEPMSASSPTALTFDQDPSGILWGPGVNSGGSLSNVTSIENAGATAADSNHYGYAFKCGGGTGNNKCNDVAIDHANFEDGVAPFYMDSASGGIHMLSAEIDNSNFPVNTMPPEPNPPAILLADTPGPFTGNDLDLGGGTIQPFLVNSSSTSQPYAVFTRVKYTGTALVTQNPDAILQVWTNETNAYGGNIQIDPFNSLVVAGMNLLGFSGPGAFNQIPNSVNYNGYGGQFSDIQIGTNGSSTNLPGYFSGISGVSGGTLFTVSAPGCSISNRVGQGDTGTFQIGHTGACTATITINGATGLAAPNGWYCSAFDATTPADQIIETATTSTTATLSGTANASDVIHFTCRGY